MQLNIIFIDIQFYTVQKSSVLVVPPRGVTPCPNIIFKRGNKPITPLNTNGNASPQNGL